MLEKARIDSMQSTLLMVSMILPTAILSLPAFLLNLARQDAWLSVIIAALAGLVIAVLVVSLSLRFPGKTLFEYAEEITGRVPGKIVGLLYIWWFLHSSALIVDEFGSFLCTAVLPNTPVIFLHIAALAVVAYAMYGGLEVLSRFNQLIFFGAITFLLVGFFLSTKEMQAVKLLPLFDTDLVSILKGSFVSASWFGEIVIFAMFIPSLNKPGKAYLVAASAVVITAFFLVSSLFSVVAVFGPYVAASWIFPIFDAVRMVSIANFLERLDPLIVAVWLMGEFVKVGVFYYAALLGSAQWLGLKDHRPLILPLGVIILSLATLCPNVVELLDFMSTSKPPYALTIFEVGIPLLLWSVALVRKKRGKAD